MPFKLETFSGLVSLRALCAATQRKLLERDPSARLGTHGGAVRRRCRLNTHQVDPGLKAHLVVNPVESTSPFKVLGFRWVNLHPYSAEDVKAHPFFRWGGVRKLTVFV